MIKNDKNGEHYDDNMVSLLQNEGDYKDFYKSGKKEDFASYDEY